MALDPRIPDKVKIGCFTYTVQANSQLGHHDVIGQARHMQLEIHIDPTVQAERQVSCLLHEILHALEEQNRFGWDETMISRIEYALFQVLRDNRLHFDEVEA